MMFLKKILKHYREYLDGPLHHIHSILEAGQVLHLKIDNQKVAAMRESGSLRSRQFCMSFSVTLVYFYHHRKIRLQII